MYKAIIFDFFDVIRTDAYKNWLNRHGFKLEGHFLELAQRMDRGEIKVDEFLIELGKINNQTPEAVFEDMEDGAKVDYDVVELVENIGKNYPVGLLSNAPSDFIRSLLKDHDLERHFNEIVISSEIGMVKPSPEMFHHILDKMDISPQEAVFIDDNVKNIQGAEAVGITGIQFVNALQLVNDLKKLNIKIT